MFWAAMLTPALQRLAKTRANFMPYLNKRMNRRKEKYATQRIKASGWGHILAKVHALLVEVLNGRLEAIPVFGDGDSDGCHESLERVASLLNQSGNIGLNIQAHGELGLKLLLGHDLDAH